ncbi:MAG: hypothetical protein KC731_05110, partial [Myxococcales bacterium]|nr:hypothetical protein [Myxococcales bacterium]
MSQRILCLGELMWDFLGEAPLDQPQRLLRPRVGGAAANVALELARRGREVALSAAVSGDAFGQAMRLALSEGGVEISALTRHGGRMGLVFISGERFLSYRPTPMRSLAPRWPRGWRGQATRTTILVAALEPDVMDGEAVLAFAREARAAGAELWVDANARPRAFRGRPKRRPWLALLREAAVVKASVHDLAVLGRDVGALATKGTLVVTDAARATQIHGAWGSLRLRPPRVAPRRSVVGAGDRFVAELLATTA